MRKSTQELLRDNSTRAREIWEELKVTRDKCGDLECAGVIARTLAAARADAVRPFVEAGLATADGKPRKVLGTLPVTKDGVIALAGERVYHPESGKPSVLIVWPAPEHDGEDKDFRLPDDCEWVASYRHYDQDTGYSENETYDIRECYSTPESARAAGGGGE